VSDRIWLSVPHMGEAERRHVERAFQENWMSTVGPNVDQFESSVATMLGHDVRALAVSSGTAALHLILRAVGVGPGDRVAVSTLTFAGSVFPILYQGAIPVFIDSEDSSGNIDAKLVGEYLARARDAGKLPRALVAVHLYGQHADVDPIAAACREHGVVLIEDAAESLGATYRGRPTATTADYSLLSFNGNKIITTTGGGMVITRDADALARMRKWANQSREPAVEYLHRELGYNYRMSNVLAGIGCGQLEVLEQRVVARRAVFERYQRALGDLPGVTFQPEAPWGRHSRWLTVLFLSADARISPDEVVSALDRDGIDSRPVWRPMHTQPLFAGCERVGGAVAERMFGTGICLPSSSSLSQADQDRVVDRFRALLTSRSR
jgi:dTDP-4-amino-4,6-dideoxygalactose transaminase